MLLRDNRLLQLLAILILLLLVTSLGWLIANWFFESDLPPGAKKVFNGGEVPSHRLIRIHRNIKS
ncbi:MAG: hypothetical protein ACQEQI_08065 [Bacillota bacterium]